ncbi:hypothetical protein [Nocardia sp. NPDC056000]|uniref:hypothetical protein n=1 Tax=Nocardia sp. NPDC056000 TaxID=3345674 RepID=UPI0035E0FD1F
MSIDDLPPEFRAALLSTPQQPPAAVAKDSEPTANRETIWESDGFEEPPCIRTEGWDDVPAALIIPDTVRLRPFTILDIEDDE